MSDHPNRVDPTECRENAVSFDPNIPPRGPLPGAPADPSMVTPTPTATETLTPLQAGPPPARPSGAPGRPPGAASGPRPRPKDAATAGAAGAASTTRKGRSFHKPVLFGLSVGVYAVGLAGVSYLQTATSPSIPTASLAGCLPHFAHPLTQPGQSKSCE